MHSYCFILIFRLDEKWSDDSSSENPRSKDKQTPEEYGNKYSGPEPTRFGDWQHKGRATDF